MLSKQNLIEIEKWGKKTVNSKKTREIILDSKRKDKE